MPFLFKNILYGFQKDQVRDHVIRSFGTRDMLKEVLYVEDKDDRTPCILIVFSKWKALKAQTYLELVKRNIEKDHKSGLEFFRIDIMASGYDGSRRCLVRRASRFITHKQKP